MAALASFIVNCYQLFIKKNGHPLLVITGAVTFFGIGGILFVLKIFKKLDLAEYLSVPYFLVHAIAATCCYIGWVPDSFQKYPKDYKY